MVAATTLAQLPEADRALITGWLTEFEQTWGPNRLLERARQLPLAGDPRRLPALQEMVRLDLAHQWQSGRRIRLEAYLKAFPELGTSETVPADLILEEVVARRRAGEGIDPARFAQRFPRQAAELALADATRPKEPPSRLPDAKPSPRADQCAPQAAAASAGPDLPEHFGHFRVMRKLGEGGMGSVYLAVDTNLDRPVALKVPRFDPEDGPEVLARFRREARTASRINHPNICPVYEAGEIDGVHYAAMAYIEGDPLSERIKSGKPLAPRTAASLVRKLAQAMREAHAQGVIHRDLKPANIMINRRQEPVVMDFGLARRVNDSMRVTRPGSVVGTPAYMAPEQIRGSPGALGPACDIYSLGVILYELLTGRLPFKGRLSSVVGRILAGDLEPPSQVQPGLDPRIEAICLRALARTPEQRFASMTEFADALTRFLKGEVAAAAPALSPMRGPATEPSAQTASPVAPPARTGWWTALTTRFWSRGLM
jgi:predicted Ser/Thr protein kinase